MEPVGLLYDSVSDNTGDKAVGVVMKRLLTLWRIPYEVVDPFAVQPNDYSSLVIGGGELIAPSGEEFYDSFRVPGAHILNTVGLRATDHFEFLRDYRYISVRSTADRDIIRRVEPELDIDVVPCISMLMTPEPCHLDLDGAIGVHVHHGIPIDLQFIANALRQYSTQHKIVFLPFTHYTGDYFVLQALSEMVPGSIVAPRLSPGQLFDAIGRLRCLIAASLHAVIFAYTQNVPVISFPVSGKIDHFLNDRQLTSSSILDYEDLSKKIEWLLDEPLDYSTRVDEDRKVLAAHTLRLQELLAGMPTATKTNTTIHAVAEGTALTAQAREQRRKRHEAVHTALQEAGAYAAQRLRLVNHIAQLEQTVTELRQKTSDLELARTDQSAQIAALRVAYESEVAALREENEQSEARHSKDIAAWQQRAVEAEAANTALRNTRSMRVIAGWWRAKAAVTQRIDHGTERGRQLTQRSALMWRTEGPAAVAGRFGRWLRGERRYYGPNAQVHSSLEEQSRQAREADRLLSLRAQQPNANRLQVTESNGTTSTLADLAEDQRSLEALARARFRAFLAAGQRLCFPDVSQPRVSIVMPVYNQAHFTYLALENLLATVQDLPYEVIIADDVSSDETSQLLSQLTNVRIHRNSVNAGFGETCNRGVELARGDYVCLLNSDTLTMPGWLDALVATMEQYPQCGAVGAKLVFPNMQLQEAGSILWQDGSASGYGRGQEPFAPEYGYLREIDFCSAACLLVRTTLFRGLGGFDQRYAPAYYEDADLCMAIRAAGYAVVYAPQAVVFHLEHASSGRVQAITLQLRNRAAFVEKWHERLADYGMPEPLAELHHRDRRPGKRMLVLDDTVPRRQLGSGFPRTLALIDALVVAGYVVTYLPTTDPRPYEPATNDLQALGVEVLYGVTDIAAKIRERQALYDIVVISRPHNAGLIAVVKEANPRALIVYDAEAVFALREARQAEIEGAPMSPDLVEEHVRDELALAASADVVLTVSQLEQRAIQRAYPHLPVMVWGHSLSLQDTTPGFEARFGLAFVGYLASAPNNDAVLQILREIMPRVAQQLNCRLVIAGTGALPDAVEAAVPLAGRVRWAGFVEDLGTVLNHCRVFVAPHRFAAGIPIKVIEAMAYGVPCVISQLLADQLGVTDGVEALVAQDEREFSEKIVQLHQDAALWHQIRDNGRAYVQANYDPTSMKRVIGDLIEAEADRKYSRAMAAC